ncbi:MAG: hypothetical protein VX501_01090 [Pseudomonadota bacterium]|nr:hypothetical protein [Pseudomonadota bacterium]
MFDPEFLAFLIQPPGPGSEFGIVAFLTLIVAALIGVAIWRRSSKPWASTLAAILIGTLVGAGWLQLYENRWDRYVCQSGGYDHALGIGRRACLWWGREMQINVETAELQGTEFERMSGGHPRVQIWSLTAPENQPVSCIANVNLYCDALVSPADDNSSDLRLYTSSEGFLERRGDRVYPGE